MRIAFLCKRRYMDKDVILDRYARLYEMPFQLAARGHDVLGLCLSYHGDAEGEWTHATPAGSLRWLSRSLGPALVPRLLGHPAWLMRQLRGFGAQYVIGASDIAHVALGAHCAKRLGLPFAADLYDNFESFGMARIPGARRTLRRAVRDADLVSCTSQALADHVRQGYGARGRVITLPSTVDLQRFRPGERRAAREALGLPRDALLVGTAGGLYADKGIGTLYRGFELLAAQHPGVHLVLAGPTDSHAPPPPGPRVHYLGRLDHARVPQLFAALDLGVIYLRDTPFGRYCFPQKAYEMAACGLPFVAADVGAMRGLLAESPRHLYAPDDAASLAHAVRAALRDPGAPPVVPQDWQALIADFDVELLASAAGKGVQASQASRNSAA
ncbi:MAG: glycosyltransferase family 4 protein [Betaproteobacteria bacterium]|nr:glycosyltransferase family 4 protein [Betaproteobacteria bacterium]